MHAHNNTPTLPYYPPNTEPLPLQTMHNYNNRLFLPPAQKLQMHGTNFRLLPHSASASVGKSQDSYKLLPPLYGLHDTALIFQVLFSGNHMHSHNLPSPEIKNSCYYISPHIRNRSLPDFPRKFHVPFQKGS